MCTLSLSNSPASVFIMIYYRNSLSLVFITIGSTAWTFNQISDDSKASACWPFKIYLLKHSPIDVFEFFHTFICFLIFHQLNLPPKAHKISLLLDSRSGTPQNLRKSPTSDIQSNQNQSVAGGNRDKPQKNNQRNNQQQQQQQPQRERRDSGRNENQENNKGGYRVSFIMKRFWWEILVLVRLFKIPFELFLFWYSV